MKLTALVCLLVSGSVARAEPVCDQGLLLKPGSSLSYVRYDATHRPIGRLVQYIESSKTEGDKTTAVMVIDNYPAAGNVKNNTTRVDVVCDGMKEALTTRNEDVIREVEKNAWQAAKIGAKYSNGFVLIDPQTYYLPWKPGTELPAYKTYSVSILTKTEEKWHVTDVNANAGYITMMKFMEEKKLATISILATTDIKVKGQETCALPGGKSSPCFHTTKNVTLSMSVGKSDIDKDPKMSAMGKAPTQTVDEWFVPGVGVSKLVVNAMGRPAVTMELVEVKSPPAAPEAAAQ